MDRDPSGYEGTRDPIFLLQERCYFLCDLPDWAESDEGGFIVKDGPSPDVRRLSFVEMDSDLKTWRVTDEVAFMKYLSDMEALSGYAYMAMEYWVTRSVFLTRDEAEIWAKATDHHYKYGWRVYCIPCDGDLAELLRNAYSVDIKRPSHMLDQILAEYQYWARVEDEGLAAFTMGAMGACSNLIAVARDLLPGKYEGGEWVHAAVGLQCREDELYRYMRTNRAAYGHPSEAVAVFIEQICLIVAGFAGMDPLEVEAMTGGRMSAELFESLSVVASLHDRSSGDEMSGKPLRSSCDVMSDPLTAAALQEAGWRRNRPSGIYHPRYGDKVCAVFSDEGISLMIGGLVVSNPATFGDLIRLESLLAGSTLGDADGQ